MFYQKYFPASLRNTKHMQLRQGSRSVSEYIAKFEELCKFSTIYQWNLDEVWKCVKFEGGLREDILAIVGPMEIKDFATAVNKCRFMEECNRKLAATEPTGGSFKKGLAPQGQRFKPGLQQKKKFQPTGNKGSSPRNLL